MEISWKYQHVSKTHLSSGCVRPSSDSLSLSFGLKEMPFEEVRLCARHRCEERFCRAAKRLGSRKFDSNSSTTRSDLRQLSLSRLDHVVRCLNHCGRDGHLSRTLLRLHRSVRPRSTLPHRVGIIKRNPRPCTLSPRPTRSLSRTAMPSLIALYPNRNG